MTVAKAAMPASALRYLAVAAANTLIYTGYAVPWVGSACAIFIPVGRLVLGEGSPVLSAATTVRLYSFLACGFLCPFSFMLVAARYMASVPQQHRRVAKERTTKEPAAKGPRQILREVLREMLQDAFVYLALVSSPFMLLMASGAFVRGMWPVKGSGRERIGSMLMDVGALGGNTVTFFITIPTAVRMTWRMKY